jgi:probable phosphoglycerate mutase
MELLLVRHGEPLVAVDQPEGADPPLSERGRQQALLLAHYLAEEHLDAVITSPLRRARQTAEPVAAAQDANLQIDEDVAEFDRGYHSYIPVEALKATDDARWHALREGRLEAFAADPDAFQVQAIKAVDNVIAAHPGQKVALVCHGGIINAFLGHMLSIPRLLWFSPQYTSINRVMASRGGVREVLCLNEVAHLRVEREPTR